MFVDEVVCVGCVVWVPRARPQAPPDSNDKVAISSRFTSTIPAGLDKPFPGYGKFNRNIARKLMERKDPFPSFHIEFMMGGGGGQFY